MTSFYGDKSVWHRKRLFGMLVGFIGVFLLVGIESITGTSDPLAIGMVLLASIGYSYAVISVTRALPNVSGIAINGLAMAITALACLPLTLTQLPDHKVSVQAFGSVVALGIFSTGLAFAVFFAMVKEVGPARASLVTYLNTAFAVVLGVIILSEPLTVGIIIGLPLVLLGSYLASRKEATV
jgi:drug/metabolite transporter (DMT)-like permease